MKLLFNIIAASLSAALLAACGSNSSVTPFKSLIPSNDAAANVRQSAPTFRVVHNFGNGDDGYFPSANMIAINGTLYGVTAAGGAYGSQPQYGGGTVFNVNAAGDEHVMYSFNPGQFYAPQGKPALP